MGRWFPDINSCHPQELWNKFLLCLSAVNDNLEAAMRALFEHFVVSNEAYDFDEAIDDKIDFINGLAMQNYRPEKDETPIPVIKIRELSQGYCDENSEFCSNHIDKSHIIQNGDLVFSWSGSLQASFWTSQTAGLNQHLFKVQSDEYPLWFVYEWVTFHLLNFQRIAENKGTTFGHIKREDCTTLKLRVLVLMKSTNLIIFFSRYSIQSLRIQQSCIA